MIAKKKKRIILTVVLSVLCLLIAAGVSITVWYRHSPFATLMQFAESVQEKDADGIFDCIEPGTAKTVKGLLKLFKVSDDQLTDFLLNYLSLDDLSAAQEEMKISGYSRDKDEAQVSLTFRKEDDSPYTVNIYFVRIEKKWYIKSAGLS